MPGYFWASYYEDNPKFAVIDKMLLFLIQLITRVSWVIEVHKTGH